MNAELAIDGPVNKLVTTGPVKLSNGTLAGFDLGAKMGALSSFAGIPKGSDTVIETFSSTVRVAPEGIRADSLDLVVPSIGSMTGNGTVGADQSLNFAMLGESKFVEQSDGEDRGLWPVAARREAGFPSKFREPRRSRSSFQKWAQWPGAWRKALSAACRRAHKESRSSSAAFSAKRSSGGAAQSRS